MLSSSDGTDRQQASPAASSLAGHSGAGLPGAGLAVVAAILSGFACWFWLLPQMAALERPVSEGVDVAGELTEVSDGDIAGALSTMSLPGSIVARLQKGDRDCSARLAFVTVSRSIDQSAQTVRLRSGNYVSPRFAVTRTPTRVAIPYPGPYQSGHGTLTILDAGESVTVALRPAWHVPANETATQAVTWNPSVNCTKP